MIELRIFLNTPVNASAFVTLYESISVVAILFNNVSAATIYSFSFPSSPTETVINLLSPFLETIVFFIFVASVPIFSLTVLRGSSFAFGQPSVNKITYFLCVPLSFCKMRFALFNAKS